MTVLLRLLFALAALGLLWGPLRRRIFRPSEPASQPTESVDDPFALVGATRERRPRGLAGAVALAKNPTMMPLQIVSRRARAPRILSVYIPLVK
jgi:hypothetical protein